MLSTKTNSKYVCMNVFRWKLCFLIQQKKVTRGEEYFIFKIFFSSKFSGMNCKMATISHEVINAL